MTTRIGKIARLPRNIRDELNRRLENGETERVILPWLNAVPEVQAVLAARFGASPISQQNLSNWRQGGYLDWLQRQEHRDLIGQAARDTKEFAGEAGAAGVADHLSTVVLAELAVAARDTEAEAASPEERYKRLRGLLHTISRVRRDNCRADRLGLVAAKNRGGG